MGLGAYPASARMARHARHAWYYEANMAMHDCDVMLCVRARFDIVSPERVDAFFAGLEEDQHRYRSVLDQQEHPRRRADHRRRRATSWRPVAVFKAEAKRPTSGVVAGHSPSGGRAIRCSTGGNGRHLPQHAIQSLFEATRGRDTYITTESRPASDVGTAVFGFEEPHRWMTSRGLGHHGLRRLRRRSAVRWSHPDSLVIDIGGDGSVQMTNAGDVDRGSARSAGQDLILNNQ